MSTTGDATAVTMAQNHSVTTALPFDDQQDFSDARRGFVDTLSSLIIEHTSGRVVWDMESFEFLDLMAVRVDGPRASELGMVLNVEFTDRDERFAVTLSNGALTYVADKWDDRAEASLHGEALRLAALTVGLADLDEALANGSITIDGDADRVRTLLDLLDQPDPTFAIVTPECL